MSGPGLQGDRLPREVEGIIYYHDGPRYCVEHLVQLGDGAMLRKPARSPPRWAKWLPGRGRPFPPGPTSSEWGEHEPGPT
jgi:hypothetical protein